MLLNLADNNHDPAALKRQDLLLAILLHVLVFIIITVLVYWQHQQRVEPLKRIEVMMISAKDLSRLQQKARPISKPKRIRKRPKPTVKPVVKPKPATKRKPVARVDDNFDPFAPLASSSDQASRPKIKVQKKEKMVTPKSPQPEAVDVIGKQLSQKEIERYIARIQAAVQEHWKVPASPGNVSDPLVEMRLLPTGHIEVIKILESSGSAALDTSLVRAIRSAAPFILPQKQFEFFRVNRIRFHPLK